MRTELSELKEKLNTRVPRADAYQREISAEKTHNDQRGQQTRFFDATFFFLPVLSLSNRVMIKVALVTGVEVAHGLRDMDYHSCSQSRHGHCGGPCSPTAGIDTGPFAGNRSPRISQATAAGR